MPQQLIFIFWYQNSENDLWEHYQCNARLAFRTAIPWENLLDIQYYNLTCDMKILNCILESQSDLSNLKLLMTRSIKVLVHLYLRNPSSKALLSEHSSMNLSIKKYALMASLCDIKRMVALFNEYANCVYKFLISFNCISRCELTENRLRKNVV